MPWEEAAQQKPPWEEAASARPAVAATSPAKPTFLSNIGLTEGPDVQLTDYPHATLSGVQSVGRGIRSAGEGLYNTVRHPIDTAKSIAAIPSQAAQIPSAIHDINRGPDPLGDYAHAAQETAGQGAGQALTALGTEGLVRGAPRVASAVIKPTLRGVGKAAGVAGDLLGNDVAGAVSPRAYHAGRVLRGVGNLAEKLGTEKPIPGVLHGPEAPPAEVLQARGLGIGGKAVEEPSAALGRIPTPAIPEAPPAAAAPPPAIPRAIAAKKIESGLNDALGARGLKPGVALRNQFKPEIPAAEPIAEGHTATEGSSALKSFKYDPATRELTTVTKSGGTYVHGEVTPEEAKAFTDAESKGLAWKQIRDNHPLVAKGSGGKVQPVKPSEFRTVGPQAIPPTENAAPATNALNRGQQLRGVRVPKGDVAETRGIQEQIREAGEQEDRARLRAAEESAAAPRGIGKSARGVRVPQSEPDLTELLKKSLAQAKRAKGE